MKIGLSSIVPINSKGDEWIASQGVYTICCSSGKLVGSGKTNAASQNPIVEGSSVVIIRNRREKTISFVVNGLARGVAFKNVADNDLHVITMMGDKADSVSLERI